VASRRLPAEDDPIRPGAISPISIRVNGTVVDGIEGQSIAGILLGAGMLAWRTTSLANRPRGVFCGIGVCFDCLITVNGQPGVRACQRRAVAGDIVLSEHDELPALPAERA
jgi:D-hydroxyproline dehydrogenase subunit gamma